MPVAAFPTDLSVFYADTIVTADSAKLRVDTVYTPVMDISGFQNIWFTAEVNPWIYDGQPSPNYIDDTVKIAWEMSPDGRNWTVFGTAIFAVWLPLSATDSFKNSAAEVDGLGAWKGNYGRGRFIYSDSSGIDADSVDNIRHWRFSLWVNGVK